jgi:hypothetical protein
VPQNAGKGRTARTPKLAASKPASTGAIRTPSLDVVKVTAYSAAERARIQSAANLKRVYAESI